MSHTTSYLPRLLATICLAAEVGLAAAKVGLAEEVPDCNEPEHMCYNGGTCSEIGCQCFPLFTSDQCEEPLFISSRERIDKYKRQYRLKKCTNREEDLRCGVADCYRVPDLYNKDRPHVFTCHCDRFFTGERCETQMKACEIDRTLCEHGKCHNTPYTGELRLSLVKDLIREESEGFTLFKCKCHRSWTGRHCDVKDHKRCVAGDWMCVHGRCKNKKTCICLPGWADKYCDRPCSFGTWGEECREKCGRCVSWECDHVTGHCDERGCVPSDDEKFVLEMPLCRPVKVEKSDNRSEADLASDSEDGLNADIYKVHVDGEMSLVQIQYADDLNDPDSANRKEMDSVIKPLLMTSCEKAMKKYGHLSAIVAQVRQGNKESQKSTKNCRLEDLTYAAGSVQVQYEYGLPLQSAPPKLRSNMVGALRSKAKNLPPEYKVDLRSIKVTNIATVEKERKTVGKLVYMVAGAGILSLGLVAMLAKLTRSKQQPHMKHTRQHGRTRSKHGSKKPHRLGISTHHSRQRSSRV